VVEPPLVVDPVVYPPPIGGALGQCRSAISAHDARATQRQAPAVDAGSRS
jgi:hypothetical protein